MGEDFSKNLNELLDTIGFTKGSFRASTFAKYCGVTRAAAHRWLTQNVIPKNLEEILGQFKRDEKIAEHIDLDSVCDWLKTGQNNPFKVLTLNTTNKQEIGKTTQLYSLVYNYGRSKGINIFQLETELQNKIFYVLYNDMEKRGDDKPDLSLLESLIAFVTVD